MHLKECSGFIVYVDESGDHSLSHIDEQYPVFVLSFCIFRKYEYVNSIVPAIRQLKFDAFGHDVAVLHEIDIRRKTGCFSKFGQESRQAFQEKLHEIISRSNFNIVCAVIDKRKLCARYSEPGHPYHLALLFGLERIHRFLVSHNQENLLTHIVCEARGKKEDRELELEFLRICDGDNFFHIPLQFDLVVADKKTNSEGLQLADLTARPIGLSVLRPDQNNRAYDVLKTKFISGNNGHFRGTGLKVFP